MLAAPYRAAHRVTASRKPRRGPARGDYNAALILAALAALTCLPAAADPTSTSWNGFDLHWDTTIRVSLGLRTQEADPSLLANPNADDGDRAFRPGPTSERTDIVTDLSGERGRFGFDVSAQGWYDPAYNTTTANTSPATYNPLNSGHRGFTPDVRDLMGRQAELLNAYVRDGADIAGTRVTVSIGRQTLLWGESLLFADNGIASAMAPVDAIKSLGAPLAEARELFLPVTQILVRASLGDGYALEAYDQLEIRRDRLPGVGSYFSTTDILDQGGQRILPSDGSLGLYRGADVIPHGIGQVGVALRQSGGSMDWGLYALRADARSPFVVLDPATYDYHLVFPRDIQIFGASVSTYAGDANVAGEISIHRNTPLDAIATSSARGSHGDAAGGGFGGNGGLGNGGGGSGGVYAAALATLPTAIATPSPPTETSPADIRRGTTINAQFSTVAQLPPGRFADGTSILAEIAGNELTDEPAPAGRTRFAAALRAQITPQYYQVRRGLDLAVPVGFGVGLIGRSSVDPSQTKGAGFVSAGVNATFHVVWQGALSFTHFIGGAGAQPLADRDFVTISVTQSF